MRRNLLWPAHLVALAALLIATAPRAAEIRVLSTNAPQAAEKQLAAQFATATGNSVQFTFASPSETVRKLKAGETYELVVMPITAIDAMAKDGAWRQGSRTELCRVGIGVALRQGVQAPDLKTPEAFRTLLLLAARSVAYPDPKVGASGVLAQRVLTQAGILDAVKPKTKFLSTGPGTAAIAKGEVELGLYNVSEIMTFNGVSMVGPVPAPWQVYTVYGGAIPASNAAPELAQALVTFITRPETSAIWKAAGLERASAAR